MFQRFYPSYDVDSTYVIEFQQLYEMGYRGIVFDIDNTLVPHGAPADHRAVELFEKLRKLGYQTMLLSNNKEPRVKMFAQQVHSSYIYKANKPAVGNYYRAMDLMGTKADNTLFVGDQLFTDIWGAKKAGMTTYLVKPIHPKEEIQIVLKRYLEKIVLFFYHRNQKRNKTS